MYDEVDDISPTFDTALRWLERRRPDALRPGHRPRRLPVGQRDRRERTGCGRCSTGSSSTSVTRWRTWPGCASRPGGSAGPARRPASARSTSSSTAYATAGGRPVDREVFHWWLVEKTLQWGIICMKQAAAHLTGACPLRRTGGHRPAGGRGGVGSPRAARPRFEASRRRPSIPRRMPTRDAGLYGRPTAVELLDAAEEFLLGAVSGLDAGQVRFHARVAANVLAHRRPPAGGRRRRRRPGPGPDSEALGRQGSSPSCRRRSGPANSTTGSESCSPSSGRRSPTASPWPTPATSTKG